MAQPFDPYAFLPADASEEEQDIYKDTDNFVGATATQAVGAPLENRGVSAALQSGNLAPPIPVTRPQPTAEQPTDPMSSLTKMQRRILAASAIQDAGAALQGREGTSFATTLKAFNDQADMRRKAEAAQAQLDMQRQIAGQFGTMPTGEGRIAELQARRQQLLQQAAMNPSMADMFRLQIAEINREIEQAEQQKAQGIQEAQGASTVLNTVSDLSAAIRANPNITGPIGMLFGALPFTEAGEARLTMETLKANLAFDTLRGIKAGGATLGAVSAPELALLEAKVANLNLNRSPEAVLKSLEEIDRYYKQIVINAYNKYGADTEQLDAMFGGRPAYVTGAEPQDLQQYTFENAPIGELVYDEANGKVFKYNGGGRNTMEAWTEVTF
jgi:hypothetical protein